MRSGSWGQRKEESKENTIIIPKQAMGSYFTVLSSWR
jgi:hypothetical protein